MGMFAKLDNRLCKVLKPFDVIIFKLFFPSRLPKILKTVFEQKEFHF